MAYVSSPSPGFGVASRSHCGRDNRKNCLTCRWVRAFVRPSVPTARAIPIRVSSRKQSHQPGAEQRHGYGVHTHSRRHARPTVRYFSFQAARRHAGTQILLTLFVSARVCVWDSRSHRRNVCWFLFAECTNTSTSTALRSSSASSMHHPDPCARCAVLFSSQA